MPGHPPAEAPYGSHQFADRSSLTGWFGKLVDLVGRDNLKDLHDKYGPLPDFERPKGGYRQRIVHLIRDNIKAGVTVSLVSIPLALSLSVSAGATPNMGLASAIWGGLLAGLLGGSQYNIAGPTASGAGILAVYSLRYGYQILPFISILSGIMMLIALLMRLDKYVLLLPSGVLHGWTMGVAFTIAGNQLASAFGVNNLKRHEQFYLNVFEVLSHLKNTQIGPFFVFLIAVIFIVSLGLMRPKIPWTIIVALTGIFLGILSSYDAWFFHMDTLYDRFNGLKFSLFQTPTFKSTFFTGEIITASFSIAFISILESLLSAKVADRITNTRFAQPLEVFGIAFANIVAGTFNGIPVTAALARTTLNVNSGATNRMAAILNALCCGVISLLLIRILGYLPMCIIAALLVNVAIRMVNLQNITHLWLNDTTMFRISIFTALVTIFMDPAKGIIYGAVLSIFLHGLRSAEAWSEITAGSDTAIVVTHSSVELDRQALQDTFERQFPATKRDDDENAVEMEAIGPRGAVNNNGARRRDEAQVALDAPVVVGGVAELPEEEDEDYLEEELQQQEQNRFFITAPKYKADHLIVRFPGELTYLNAEPHADRLAPLLSTGRFLILHLKRTYYIDMDGMDLLTNLVLKVEKMGKRVIVSGLTAQTLPNLEAMDWFIRAREEDRIVANYRAAIAKIREIDREDQRQLEERNYHDITMYELEESRRHSDSLASMERARLHREEAAAKLLAEDQAQELEQESKRRAEEEARKIEIATQQARLDAKRKADAEEFQKRLIEFEKKKQERETARIASLAAIASSSIAGEPSISVPHHSDHHQLRASSSSSVLKLQETPIHTDAAHTQTSIPVVNHPAPQSEVTPTQVETPQEASTSTPTEHSVIAEHIEQSAPKEHHVPQVIIETPKEEETPKEAEVLKTEPETGDGIIDESVEETLELEPTASVTADLSLSIQEEPSSSESSSVTPSEKEETTTTKEDETSTTKHEEELTAMKQEEAIVTQEPETATELEVPVSLDPEDVVVDTTLEDTVPVQLEDAVPLSKSSSNTSVHATEENQKPPSEPTTPPPESETSSVASDGPLTLQLSPRRDHPEPQAPLDLDDPLSQEPDIPTSDSAPLLSTSIHEQQVEHEVPSVIGATAPAAAPTTVSFLDPFAEFEEASTNLSTTSATSVPTTPSKSIGHIDYVDPFDQFGVVSDEPQPTSSVPSTPQKAPESGGSNLAVQFDPFADLLSDSSAGVTPAKNDPDSEEELLL